MHKVTIEYYDGIQGRVREYESEQDSETIMNEIETKYGEDLIYMQITPIKEAVKQVVEQ